MAALNAVTATNAVAMEPAMPIIHCPSGVSTTQRTASVSTPSAVAAQPTAGKKIFPTEMARFVNLLDNNCKALAVVLLRVSYSACMEPA